MATIRTENHIDNEGAPAKKLVIEYGEMTLSMNLGFDECRLLSNALKPEGKNIKLEYGKAV